MEVLLLPVRLVSVVGIDIGRVLGTTLGLLNLLIIVTYVGI